MTIMIKPVFMFFVLAASLLSACQTSGKGYRISGSAEGKESGMVYLQQFRNKMYFTIDSSVVQKGKFNFKGKVEMPALYALQFKEAEDNQPFFLDNSEITAVWSADGTLKTEGSPSQDLYQSVVDQVDEEDFDIKGFVAANPASNVTAYILYRNFSWRLEPDTLENLASQLDSSLSESPYIQELREIIRTLRTVEVGKTAPDFTLPDPEGNPFTLSSLKGQYVLIDFWASWCPPCRAENPNVVVAYNQYKDKGFTVLGVSLDREKQDWLDGIAQDQLTWHHVSDLKFWDSAPAALYGIRAIPSNLLIDREGVIIAKNLREEALQEKLAEIFGK